MAKRTGGEGKVIFTLKPVPPATTGVQVNLCVTSLDSIDFPKGYAPSHTTCDYNAAKKVTFTKREQTTSTLRFSCTAFSEDQLTEDQEEELFDANRCGPVILQRQSDKGFYMDEATVEVSYKPGGVEALQTFTITGESYGEWVRGTSPPGP
jgi:hypothetical protein